MTTTKKLTLKKILNLKKAAKINTVKKCLFDDYNVLQSWFKDLKLLVALGFRRSVFFSVYIWDGSGCRMHFSNDNSHRLFTPDAVYLKGGAVICPYNLFPVFKKNLTLFIDSVWQLLSLKKAYCTHYKPRNMSLIKVSEI